MNTRLILGLALLGQFLAFAPGARGQVYEKLFSFTAANSASNGPRRPQCQLVQSPDGNFYGTTTVGGLSDAGTVFKMTPDGTVTNLVTFTGDTGANKGRGPAAGLVRGSDGNFYGTTEDGGANSRGTVFRMTPDGALTTLVEFTGTTGSNKGTSPRCKLVQGTDGNFYGTTSEGGTNDAGTVFRMTTAGVLTTLVEFTGNGASNKGSLPFAGLVQASDGNFYGTTLGGGVNGNGTVFKMTPSGVLTTLVNFTGSGGGQKGRDPNCGLVQLGGLLYGTSSGGGVNDQGTIFSISTGGAFTTLVEFAGNGATNAGGFPVGDLVAGATGDLFGTTTSGGNGTNRGTVFRVTPTGVLTTLVSFSSATGSFLGDQPSAGLIIGSDGSLYGTTEYSGANVDGSSDGGTIFKVSPTGVFANLVEFPKKRNFGENPNGNIAFSPDGTLFGTAAFGGGSGLGTCWTLTPEGSLSVLHSFTGTLTIRPRSRAGLVRSSDGSFFGTTEAGGANNLGTIFRITPSGQFTTLVEFTGNGPANRGSNPQGPLLKASNGLLYGTTSSGGAFGFGTIFNVTEGGTLTTLIDFTGNGATNKGSSPDGNSLIEGSDGNFYGGTNSGGSSGKGTIFRMTPAGALTTLVEFTGNGATNKGDDPQGRMAVGADGNFYGTTSSGGGNSRGTVFRMTPAGVLTTLFSFTTSGAGIGRPTSGLVLANDGNFYGTTGTGGSTNYGQIIKVTPAGVVTSVFDFSGDIPDAGPSDELVQGPDDCLYGVTGGAIYRLLFPGVPIVATVDGQPHVNGSASVSAKVNGRGQATAVSVEYGTDGVTFGTTAPVAQDVNDWQTHLVGTVLSGLDPATTYSFRFRATNSAGTTVGPIQSFSTQAPPVVTVEVATDVNPTSATFNGTVNARNFDTAVIFEWGNDGLNFPNMLAAMPGTVTGNAPVPVSAAVVVPQGSTVFFRIRAMNAGGTVTTGARGFNTGLGATTTALNDNDIGVNEATFKATVNTYGQAAAVKFKYWADSAPGTIFETATQAVTTNGPQEVSARVTGLLENVSYSYRVSVELAGTETDGGAVMFTTDTNEAPVAVNDLVFYSGQVVVDPLANDTDPNEGSNVNLLLAPALVVAPDASRGVASVTNDRRGISYNPQFNVLDDDALTYRVVDPLGASADGQVRLIAFSKRAGLYGGKIMFGSGASAREGQVAVQMGGGGAISTSFLNWGGESFRLKGVFDQRGRFTRTLNSPGGAVLTITLALDADAPRMLGTFEERVNEVSTTGEIAFVLTKDAGTGGLAESGLRTGFLSPPSAQAGVMADGYLRMTVGKDARRGARFAGRLPDGEPFLTGARAQGRTYSLARALEQGGVFTGLVRAIDGSAGAGGMMGNLLWQKRASSRARYERGGVSSVLSLSGVAYPALERGALPPLGANVRLILGGVRRGDGSAVSYRDLLMQLVPGGMVAQIVGSDPAQATGEDIPLTKLQVKVDAVNAAFRGRFLHPATGRTVPFDGALRMPFDGESVQGRGVFRGPGSAGSVRLEAD